MTTTNQTMAGVHDSATCALGPNGGPCDWCADVNRREAARQVASLATVRAALFDVIDAGAPSGWWELYDDGSNPEVTEDMVNKERCDFADAVIARITQLQQPPHGMDTGRNDAVWLRAALRAVRNRAKYGLRHRDYREYALKQVVITVDRAIGAESEDSNDRR